MLGHVMADHQCSHSERLGYGAQSSKSLNMRPLAHLGSCSTCLCSSLSQGITLWVRPKGSLPSLGPR